MVREAAADNSILWYWAARGGADDFTCFYRDDGTVTVWDLAAFTVPWRVVSGSEGYRQAIREMKVKQADHFVLLLDKTLYQLITSDKRTRLEMQLSAGLLDYGQMYTSQGSARLEYENCVYWDGTLANVSSEAEAMDAIERLAAAGYDAMALSFDERTWQRISANNWEQLNTMEALSFIACGFTYYDAERILLWNRDSGSIFYPGYEILRAVSKGMEGTLPLRYRQTLAVARELLDGVSGTEADMALEIHDRLCEHATYIIDDTTDDDDRCVGALLNGRANCDGYADAYALLCGLKGITVRLFHGDSFHKQDVKGEETHLWNLILLDGVWRSVDVTWDDQDGGETGWIYYNIGLDRMREHYIFIEDLLPKNMLAATDLLDRPVPEYRVDSEESAVNAMRGAAALMADHFILWMGEELYQTYRRESQRIWIWQDLAGIMESRVQYSDDERKVEISNPVYNDGSVFAGAAETERELLAVLYRVWPMRDVTEVHLYLSEAL
ncbi:MAG: hypothetical protein IJ174_04435, partial [Clostridia bacterium]|nr:hypothetical protein [Clostridia bacterium]